MIIVQLRGGLGNQLFQYAAGLSLAKHNKTEVKVDINALKQPDEIIGTTRIFELQHLKHPPEIATELEIATFLHQPTFKRYAEKILPPYKRSIYKEAAFTFDPNFFKAGGHLYLKGYRQSEKYFQPIQKTIRDQFEFRDELIKDVNGWAAEMQQVNSVSIHIRRGDYKNKSLAEYHGMVPLSFYEKAIETILKDKTDPVFYVFSDDITWAKDHLGLTASVNYLSGGLTAGPYQDFYLMSQCRHNIIANSSFSWWAAWLNPNPDKMVIAPKQWFQKKGMDTSDLIPSNWIRI